MNCGCIKCRRKEFNEEFALYLYSHLMDEMNVCRTLMRFGIKEEKSLAYHTIGSFLYETKSEIDEFLQKYIYDMNAENKKYMNYLKKHGLWEELSKSINEFMIHCE